MSAERPASPVGESLRLIAEPDNMIHAAVDVLTVRHPVSREEATDLLRQATNDQDRSLAQVAEDVVLLGLPSVAAQIELRPEPQLESFEAPQTSSPRGLSARAALIDTAAAALLERLVEVTTVPDMLTVISELAIDVVPGCEAAGVTLLRERAAATMASADSRARRVDEAQYRNGVGPYLKAAHTRRLVRVDDISSVPSEQVWARVALEAGFAAVLVVPIVVDPETAATMSLYARRGDGWSPQSLVAAETLAEHAGTAIAIAQRLDPHVINARLDGDDAERRRSASRSPSSWATPWHR